MTGKHISPLRQRRIEDTTAVILADSDRRFVFDAGRRFQETRHLILAQHDLIA